MLKLVIGTDWIANRNLILSRISDAVLKNIPGQVLLVPELISHDTERRLAEAAGDTCSRFAEVLSFSRLARRISDAAGCKAVECMDNGGRVVVMAAAVRQLVGKLKSYASVETRPEFLTGLVEAIDEFKRCCISAEDLKHASEQTEGQFAQKLEELSLILSTYDALSLRGKRDPRDQMTWVLEQLECSDFAAEHNFYVDGFPDFTRQNFMVIEHFLLNSDCVTVSLNCDEPGSKKIAFEKAGQTALALLQFAKNNGIPYSVEIIPPNTGKLAQMRDRLFQGNISQFENLSGSLILRQADNLHEECTGAAARVLELIQSGARYRDICIVCSDMPTYEDAIRMVFGRARIPIYRSGTDSVLQKTVVSALLSALRAALGNFEKADVLRYIKSVLCTLDDDVCDQIENYTFVWNITGSRWLKKWENHPDGLSGIDTEESTQKLNALECAREIVIEPLVRLRDGFHNSEKLGDEIRCLYRFMEDIRLADTLSILADQMDAEGDNRSAQILNQLWDILLGAMEQLYDVLGDTAWDDDSFTRLFTLLLSQYDVGTIPTVLDSVSVGSFGAMRCHQCKHLILLGAQEGLLPGYNGSTGVLSDREREQLRQLNVPLTGGGMEGLQAEFADIYGVFCGAADSVLVSYCEGQPSFLYKRFATMAGGDAKYEHMDSVALTDQTDAAAYLVSYSARDAAEKLGIQENYDRFLKLQNYTLGAVSASEIRSLYGKRVTLSASQIDKLADCRFSYFLRYGLRAKELKEASVDPAEFGTYFHAVLEKTAKRVMELGGFHVVSLEDTVELALKYSSEYIEERFSALNTSRISYLFERNVQELVLLVKELWEELHVSLFEPELFEVSFGDGKTMPAVNIPNSTLPAQIGGFVDRVDKWFDGNNNYFRVVDYKTGEKSFDYCDVFNGMGLQMLLYMFALEQGGADVLGSHPVPVGVQYFSARFLHLNSDCRMNDESVEKERADKLKRKGLLLSDEAVLTAMQPEETTNRLRAERNKKGEIVGDVATRAQFKMLRTYIFRLLNKLVDEIASGSVEPNPYTRGGSHNACMFCPYGAVCHSASVPGRRNYQAMKAARFWEEIEKEVASGG